MFFLEVLTVLISFVLSDYPPYDYVAGNNAPAYDKVYTEAYYNGEAARSHSQNETDQISGDNSIEVSTLWQ